MQNKQKEMALKKGYVHVEEIEQIMFENAGDLIISVDDIMWMNDCTLKPLSYVSVTY